VRVAGCESTRGAADREDTMHMASSPNQKNLCHPTWPSPNLANILPHHRVAPLASEPFRKLSHIRKRPVHAEFRHRVRIRGGEELFDLRPFIDGPDLRVSEEKPLLRREFGSVVFRRLAPQRPQVTRSSAKCASPPLPSCADFAGPPGTHPWRADCMTPVA
jgi:hypothetical protein